MSTTSRARIMILLTFGLSLSASLLVYIGVVLEGDDVLYARLAAAMASGEPLFFINTHTTRLGFVAPLALLYSVFGVHNWTTIAFPLLCTAFTIVIAGVAAEKLYGRKAACWAMLICGLNPILYRYGSTGMADIPAGLFYGTFVIGWILGTADHVRNRSAWAFLSGLACAWAMMTRLSTAPMIILTISGFLFLGLRRPALHKFPYFSFILGGCLVGLPYLLFLWWHTSTPFYFLLAEGTGFNNMVYDLIKASGYQPLHGLLLWVRASGLSILRASIEGFLFASFPVIAIATMLGRNSTGSALRDIRVQLLIAVISPLLILSHFSTSVMHWSPVTLDLRFGSPTMIPAAVLLGAACVHMPGSQLPGRARWCGALVLMIASALLFLGWWQHNPWTIAGAAASIVIGIAVLKVQSGHRLMLPLLILTVLTVNFWYYRHFEYRNILARNNLMRSEAESIPWNTSLNILTDSLTAQFLPYLHGFPPTPRVATWKGLGDVEHSSFWAEKLASPWLENYILVWYPKQAMFTTGRFGGQVPEWVLQEVKKGKLLHPFENEVETFINVFELRKRHTNEYLIWPKPGIYQIEGNLEK